MAGRRWAVFRVRCALAVALLFGSQILLWTQPLARPLTDWFILLPTTFALSTILLDLVSRFHLKDIYDAMTLMALYGLLSALIINPQLAFVDLPRTLVTRVLGGNSLIGLEMWGLFMLGLGAFAQKKRIVVLASFVVGFSWGIWVRWTPILTDRAMPVRSDVVALNAASFAFFVLIAFWVIWRDPPALEIADLQLSRFSWVGVGLVLGLALAIRLAQGLIPSSIWLPIGALLLLCWAILWFRGTTKRRNMLANCWPPRTPPLAYRTLVGAFFILGALLASALPFFSVAGINQLSVVEFGFLVAGFLWLPLIASVVAIRALDREARTGQL